MEGSVLTPWGRSDRLKERRLKPGPGNLRADVERNQRERLYGALVAVVDEKGLEHTSVADVAARAGVSRSVVYEYFDGRPGLFQATFEALVAAGLGAVESSYRQADEDWESQLRAALSAMFETVTAQPAAARLCFLEAYAAGPAVEPIRDAAGATAAALVRAAFDCSAPRRGMPEDVVEGIVGGIRTITQTRLRRHTERELPDLVDELTRWMAAYERPVPPLTPAETEERRGAGFVAATHPERIYVAMAKAIAAKGYAHTSVADIVTTASVSLSTFYEHFDGKEQAFLAACDFGIEQAFASVRQSWERAAPDGWPAQVHAGMRELLSFLAAEPEWSFMAMVEIFAAGSRARARRDRTIELFTSMVEPGRAVNPAIGPVTVEVLGGAVYSLMYRQIRLHGAARLGEILPATVFVLLAPFVGSRLAAQGALAPLGA
ncbi:MAG: TetR/AcrR family transcriptional regulator [Solirubrobacterales bacterium]|nr:TetR/AcrR family transcriptional regulator [Solirubrobacterales bacterium]